ATHTFRRSRKDCPYAEVDNDHWYNPGDRDFARPSAGECDRYKRCPICRECRRQPTVVLLPDRRCGKTFRPVREAPADAKPPLRRCGYIQAFASGRKTDPRTAFY